MRITFIGGGNMASALIGGLLAGRLGPGDIRVVDPSEPQRTVLARRFGVGVFASADAAVPGSDVTVLSVKPQQMREAATAIAPLVGAQLVISVAAGIRATDLSRWLNGHARLVRAMPNTPALVGKGISGVYAPSTVDESGRALAAAVLDAVGDQVWVDTEAMLDAVTGVSGSGPAYVFYFLEALEEAARDLGFSAHDARRLAYATFAGAVALAQASPEAPAVLRAQVTSRGGTTERALATMDADAVKAKIVAAVKAAVVRAGELGDVFGKDT